MGDSNIKIYNSHQPALTDGYYKIHIAQAFEVVKSSDQKDTLNLPGTDMYFTVEGEQYSLTPGHIDSVFPPVSAMGDFSGVLPHIILNRSTLPWERKINESDPDVKPWLALLLFTEDEINDPARIKKINVTKENWEAATFAPAENTDPSKISLSALLIESNFLNTILPAYNELECLAHVRGNAGDEKAIVISGRMPAKNKKNYAHLVSLEDMYSDNHAFTGKLSNGFYGFASLTSWEFFCNDHFIVTPEILESDVFKQRADINGQVRLAISKIPNAEFFSQLDFLNAIKADSVTGPARSFLLDTFEVAHLPSILRHLDRTPANLRLPGNDDLSVSGYLKISYQLKKGDTVPAVYRGPLAPVKTNTDDPVLAKLPVIQSDKLFRFVNYGGENAVDVSYASAWELGRLLALRDKNFSAALFQWKRKCYQYYKEKNDIVDSSHLILSAKDYSYPEMPDFVRLWFNDLLLLKGIPFNYLVPEESFLPFESLRFFIIDENWMRSLVDGAFSIGRISQKDILVDKDLYCSDNLSPYSGNIKSGFFLRSRAVSGWPDLVVECNVDITFRNKLAPDLLMCLSNGSINSLSINQKPESIHFGFEDDDTSSANLSIVYRDDKGKEQFFDISVNDAGKVNIKGIYEGLKFNSVADFVNAIIQKIEKITFVFR